MNQVNEAHTVIYFLCSQEEGDRWKDAIGHDHKDARKEEAANVD